MVYLTGIKNIHNKRFNITPTFMGVITEMKVGFFRHLAGQFPSKYRFIDIKMVKWQRCLFLRQQQLNLLFFFLSFLKLGLAA